MIELYKLFLFFALYSTLGWICESIWCSVGTGKLVNRGFLSGPYCPVYGFGALLILAVCMPFVRYPAVVYLMAMVFASVLEYWTGWLLETLFHTKWWDYSKRKFQIKGRVCLRNSLLFGLLGLALTYWVHPLAEDLINAIPRQAQMVLAGVIAVIYAVDLSHTLTTLISLRERLARIHEEIAALRELNEQYAWLDVHDIHGSLLRAEALCAEHPEDETARALRDKIQGLLSRQPVGQRILRAFPGAEDHEFGSELKALREKLRSDAAARKEARRRKN